MKILSCLIENFVFGSKMHPVLLCLWVKRRMFCEAFVRVYLWPFHDVCWAGEWKVRWEAVCQGTQKIATLLHVYREWWRGWTSLGLLFRCRILSSPFVSRPLVSLSSVRLFAPPLPRLISLPNSAPSPATVKASYCTTDPLAQFLLSPHSYFTLSCPEPYRDLARVTK